MNNWMRGWVTGFGLLAAGTAGAVDYAGSGVGAIPDNNPTGLNVSFNTNGFSGPLGHVRVSLSMTHTFVGDLRATLISPNGLARLVLFSRVGYKRGTSPGISANLSGQYVFDDQLGADLWATVAPLATGQSVPTGPYRTSTGGANSISDIGGCSTHLDLAFGGLSSTQASGIWTLSVVDLANGDTGSVNAATLTLQAAPTLFASGFESTATGPAPVASGAAGVCKKALYDFSGDGRSDFVTVRNTGGGPSGAITWTILESNGTAGVNPQSFVHGNATDFFIDGDFDGDGIGDPTVWKSAQATYYVRRSSRPLDALLEIPWGQLGDDPTHVGDYDGDGVDDAAVYRDGATPGAPSFFLIRLSSTGALRTMAAGEDGSFPSAGIDLNGDNRADITVQSNAGGGNGRFRSYGGSSGFSFLATNLGLITDSIVLGNHAGTLRGDITLVRSVGGVFSWVTRETFTGTVQQTIEFGQSGDFVVTGDYDGDGLDDHALWRPSSAVGLSKFIVRRSTSVAVPIEVPSGLQGDYPVARSRIH